MIAEKATELDDLRPRVEAGEWLTLDDGRRLYESPDIFTLGELANAVRERLHGRNAYYNINRHINYTNYCVLRCKFCSFYRPYQRDRAAGGMQSRRAGSPRDLAALDGAAPPPQAPPLQGRGASGTVVLDEGSTNDGGYELSIDEIVARAKEAYSHGATEVHIVGGLHPKLTFDYYTGMCAAIREFCPHLHIKAFTAIEIIHFTRIAKPRLTIAEVLTKLREAGLGSMPGGGAEIFDDRVHDEAFKNKVGEAEWFEVHRTAHELGIFTNATMLYGHVERPVERIKHLVKLRAHQAESLRSRPAHFNCVIPLSFIPEGSALSHLPGPGGLDDLRTLAISRLMCPNIPHIKAFWIMQTPKIAQISLNWGVDDIDGTVVYYDITKREGGGATHQELSVDKLQRLIVEARCKPVERDTLYRRVNRDERSWRIEGESFSVPYEAGPNEGERGRQDAEVKLSLSR